jgi:hypothetical protein
MNLLKDEMDKEGMNFVGYKNKSKVVRTLPQVHVKTNRTIDASRHALPPGKRISKTGHVYWETRSNRTDVRGSSY